jgi:hypothetical protein
MNPVADRDHYFLECEKRRRLLSPNDRRAQDGGEDEKVLAHESTGEEE